jgi:hypothetical protein
VPSVKKKPIKCLVTCTYDDDENTDTSSTISTSDIPS